jgi:hypothetical protein
MTERCEVARCRAEAALTYLDHGICDRHWNQLTAEDAPPNALRMALGIAEGGPTATEDQPMEPTTSKTKKTEMAAAPATSSKGLKPETKKAKAAKEPKQKKASAAKEATPKKEKASKEPQVVFAFRLTEAQRDQIHKAAGPGKATRFVLAAALAAASGDRAAFEELLKSSQK